MTEFVSRVPEKYVCNGSGLIDKILKTRHDNLPNYIIVALYEELEKKMEKEYLMRKLQY